jgi:hypothetical protein
LVLPAEAIREAVVRLGVQKRRRDLDPVALTYSLVLQGGTWECAEKMPKHLPGILAGRTDWRAVDSTWALLQTSGTTRSRCSGHAANTM